jgi:tetratricopeptide (TPR) repeat protein
MRRLLLLAFLLPAGSLPAQEDSTLAAAVQLSTEGQSDSARSLLQGAFATVSPRDSLYPGLLYAAGVVAGDVDSAMNYFRRVSIEYPRSAWADSAFLRLAQVAFAAGDAGGALRSSERVLSDYPLSELHAEASFWTARALLELGRADEGCQLLVQARDEAVVDVELANRAAYHLQRCAAVLAAADTTPDSVAPATPPPGRQVYSVQVAAVGTATAADEVMQSLAAAGYQPHVVRDTDGLFKVRVGRHANRAEAQRQVAPIRRAVGGSPFVVEER